MTRLTVAFIVLGCFSPLAAQNNITNKLGTNGEFRVLKNDNTTQVLTVHESNGFVSAQKTAFTPEGGLAIRMTNRTGSPTVKGTIITASSVNDNAFMTAPASSDFPCGVVYEDGIADGSDCWVVVSGVADVLMKDSNAATRGYVTKVSDAQGRAVTEPAPGTNHDKEIGHSLESKSAGTNVLIKVVLHFR